MAEKAAKKKTVKKKTVKKNTATKKKKSKPKNENSPKEIAKLVIDDKTLKKVPFDVHFVLYDGRRVDSLRSLVAALEDMDDHVFLHHVNDDKNDFATWIAEIIEDRDLAMDLHKVKSKAEHELKILRRIVHKMEKIIS